MSTPLLIRVRLLRALRLADGVHLAGACLDLPAAEVRDLLRNCQAVLAHEADLALLLDSASPIDGRRPAMTR